MSLKRNYLSYENPILEESLNDILNYPINFNQSELGSYISFKKSTMDQKLRKTKKLAMIKKI
jgi:hypothetical protein